MPLSAGGSKKIRKRSEDLQLLLERQHWWPKCLKVPHQWGLLGKVEVEDAAGDDNQKFV